MNSKSSFLVHELETIDTCKQYSLLVSHSEYNVAKKRNSIFDSTQPFFPPWQDIRNFWILPSTDIHLYEFKIWFVRKNLWIGTKPLQIFDCLFIFKFGVDLIHELYQQYSQYSTSQPNQRRNAIIASTRKNDWRYSKYGQRSLKRTSWQNNISKDRRIRSIL